MSTARTAPESPEPQKKKTTGLPAWVAYLEPFARLDAEYVRRALLSSAPKPRWALITEPRNDPLLVPVVKNVAALLGPLGWGVCVRHGPASGESLRRELGAAICERLVLDELETDDMPLVDYSRYMKQPQLWRRMRELGAETVLTFQTDTLLLRPERVERFADEGWAYVGAPWADVSWHTIGKVLHRVGNGGFSLRNVEAMIAASEMESRRPLYNKVLPEDIALSRNCLQLGLPVPPPDVAAEFAVESIYHPDPAGMHNPLLIQAPLLQKMLSLRWDLSSLPPRVIERPEPAAVPKSFLPKVPPLALSVPGSSAAAAAMSSAFVYVMAFTTPHLDDARNVLLSLLACGGLSGDVTVQVYAELSMSQRERMVRGMGSSASSIEFRTVSVDHVNLSQDEAAWGESHFAAITQAKMLAILDVLRSSGERHILWLDTDLFFFSDPRPPLLDACADSPAQTVGLFQQGCVSTTLCTGFFLLPGARQGAVHSNLRSQQRRLIEDTLSMLRREVAGHRPRGARANDDEDCLNRVVSEMRIPVARLDLSVFANGAEYFERGVRYPDVVMMHNNFIRGRATKERRMKDHMLWLVDAVEEKAATRRQTSPHTAPRKLHVVILQGDTGGQGNHEGLEWAEAARDEGVACTVLRCESAGESIRRVAEVCAGMDAENAVLVIRKDIHIRATPAELLARCEEVGAFPGILLGARKANSLAAPTTKFFPTRIHTPYRFVNPECYIGTAGDIVKAHAEIEARGGTYPQADDAAIWSWLYAVFGVNGGAGEAESPLRVQLDMQCALFQTTSIARAELDLVARTNLLTDTRPLVWHEPPEATVGAHSFCSKRCLQNGAPSMATADSFAPLGVVPDSFASLGVFPTGPEPFFDLDHCEPAAMPAAVPASSPPPSLRSEANLPSPSTTICAAAGSFASLGALHTSVEGSDSRTPSLRAWAETMRQTSPRQALVRGIVHARAPNGKPDARFSVGMSWSFAVAISEEITPARWSAIYRTPGPERDQLVICCFDLTTDRSRRGPIRATIAKTIQSGPLALRNKPIPIDKYIEELGRSKFVISPEGDQVDCHRHYEAILMGAVPIIEDSPEARAKYGQMPVLFTTQRYAELTPAYLEAEYARILCGTYDLATMLLANHPPVVRTMILDYSRLWMSRFAPSWLVRNEDVYDPQLPPMIVETPSPAPQSLREPSAEPTHGARSHEGPSRMNVSQPLATTTPSLGEPKALRDPEGVPRSESSHPLAVPPAPTCSAPRPLRILEGSPLLFEARDDAMLYPYNFPLVEVELVSGPAGGGATCIPRRCAVLVGGTEDDRHRLAEDPAWGLNPEVVVFDSMSARFQKNHDFLRGRFPYLPPMPIEPCTETHQPRTLGIVVLNPDASRRRADAVRAMRDAGHVVVGISGAEHDVAVLRSILMQTAMLVVIPEDPEQPVPAEDEAVMLAGVAAGAVVVTERVGELFPMRGALQLTPYDRLVKTVTQCERNITRLRAQTLTLRAAGLKNIEALVRVAVAHAASCE